MNEEIKIHVTQESFDENFSIDEWFNFSKMSNSEMYEKMLLFVVDNDGNPIPPDDARKLFGKVKKKEWTDYVVKFMRSVNDAFVSPTNGGS